MNKQALKSTFAIALTSTLLAVSAGAHAAADVTSTTRDQRMDSALQNYRDMHRNEASRDTHRDARNSQPGRFARAENSVKSGVQRTGSAVKKGASKVGAAVSNAGHKTANALRTTGDKIHSKIGD